MNLIPHSVRWTAMSAKAGLKSYIATARYRFWHWLFQWVLDHEGDVGLLVANTLLLVKYKEHTCFYWSNPFKSTRYRPAPKHLHVSDPMLTFDPGRRMIFFYNTNKAFDNILHRAIDVTSDAFLYVSPNLVWDGFGDIGREAVVDVGEGKIVALLLKGDDHEIDDAVVGVVKLFNNYHADGIVRGLVTDLLTRVRAY